MLVNEQYQSLGTDTGNRSSVLLNCSMVGGMVCCLGPANPLLGSPEDGLRLVIGQGLGITTLFWRVRVFNSMDVGCSTTVGLRAREWARVSFHLPVNM